MKIITIILILACLHIHGWSQVAPQKYFVEFIDKKDSPYAINRPNEFLSQRAIERRQRQGIPVVANDIPVNQGYVNRVREYGVEVLTRSKWFNGITIYTLNSMVIDSILRLPFVKRVLKSDNDNFINDLNSVNKFTLEEVSLKVLNTGSDLTPNRYNSNSGYNYGPSYNQIHMLKGDSLHKLGYRGEGMIIAVLDAGFLNADTLSAFDSLRANNQILGTRDFVKPGNNVYHEYEHGMEVLSCMGGNLPGKLVGTAPKASYWLLRSEDFNSEFLIEEYNWVSAAEFADSAGVDIINSSLGYTRFDDPVLNHTCQDMNGNTTPVTKGANLAASKGILVVNSAGNSGTSDWHCVSAPADAFSVLSVAAVDSNGIRAPFSSLGEATLRIKPNVASMGKGAVVASTIGSVMYNNGTSFSSPIMAGLAACLWQAAPSWDNFTLIRAIELSSNQVSHPDSLLGFGIPDFIRALQHAGVCVEKQTGSVKCFPNPFNERLSVRIPAHISEEYEVVLLNTLGMNILTSHFTADREGENEFFIDDPGVLPNGTYMLRVSVTDFQATAKVVKTGH